MNTYVKKNKHTLSLIFFGVCGYVSVSSSGIKVFLAFACGQKQKKKSFCGEKKMFFSPSAWVILQKFLSVHPKVSIDGGQGRRPLADLRGTAKSLCYARTKGAQGTGHWRTRPFHALIARDSISQQHQLPHSGPQNSEGDVGKEY